MFSSNELCSSLAKYGGLCQFGKDMSYFFLLFLHEFVEVVECVTEGGEIKEMGDKLVAPSEQFENFVAVSIIFDITPEFVSSKGDWLFGHCQNV